MIIAHWLDVGDFATNGAMRQLGIGLYGSNGHQIHQLVAGHARAKLVAVAGMEPTLAAELGKDTSIRVYPDLASMLADERVQMVSLCSPRRVEQARHAIECLRAGKHVYAEKPAAMNNDELDAVLQAAKEAGRKFHEMAGTVFDAPYYDMRQFIRGGTIGEVVQVFAQKSYPYHDKRSADENIDGGLLRQVGIHAVRMVEHVTGIRVTEMHAVQTTLGDPKNEGLVMACATMLKLANGGVGVMSANYLNPRGFGQWGNEELRIFGDRGMAEVTDGGRRTHVYLADRDAGEIPAVPMARSFLDQMIDEILDGTEMEITLEEELHPLRVVNAACGEMQNSKCKMQNAE